VGRGLAAQDHIRHGFRWPVRCTTILATASSQTFSRVAAASRSRLNSAAAAATREEAPITPDNWTVHIGGYSHPASD